MKTAGQHSKAAGQARVNHRSRLVAAPPDDGGHMGSYTVPEDTLAVDEERPHGMAAPALSSDAASIKQDKGANATWYTVALVFALVLAVLVFAVYRLV